MAKTKLSPLAPKTFPQIPPVAGVELGAIAAGLRYVGRPDLMIASFVPGTVAAGLFTQSLAAAAPVIWSRDRIAAQGGKIRALIVNAGYANAFTGKRGMKTVEVMAEGAAEVAGCKAGEVLVASTGVIGATMPPGPLRKGIKRLEGGLSQRLYCEAAQAIRTTDTFAKGSFRVSTVDNHPVTIAGIAKGSGMIEPNMATMLGFIFTSAPVSQKVLDTLLRRAVAKSFNAITVDGDTSTNDCLLAFATGGAYYPVIEDADDPRLNDFAERLCDVCRDLALQIVRDGEGAEKLVTITVEGAQSDAAAMKIAKTIANSPLVKTAIAGEDPNWGRVIAAAGRAGEAIDMDALQFWIGDMLVAHKGMVHLRYDEATAAAHMKGREIFLKLDVGVGEGAATAWTCDLTHAYIDINADYRS